MTSIEENVKTLKTYLEENIREKENIPEIPETGMAVLRQQLVLAEVIETWIASFSGHNYHRRPLTLPESSQSAS